MMCLWPSVNSCVIYIDKVFVSLVHFTCTVFAGKIFASTDSSSVQHCAAPETVTNLLGCNEQCKNAWVYYIGRSKLCSNTAIINHTIWYAAYFLNSFRSVHLRAYRYTHFINCNSFHFQVSSINYTTTTNSPGPPSHYFTYLSHFFSST